MESPNLNYDYLNRVCGWLLDERDLAETARRPRTHWIDETSKDPGKFISALRWLLGNGFTPWIELSSDYLQVRINPKHNYHEHQITTKIKGNPPTYDRAVSSPNHSGQQDGNPPPAGLDPVNQNPNEWTLAAFSETSKWAYFEHKLTGQRIRIRNPYDQAARI
jgi:hypothetical protein